MRIKGSIGRFFSGVLISRITGFGRDLAMAFAFGDHPSLAAFMVAFRLANLLRRVVAEGPFQSAFIPYFEALQVDHSEEKALVFFRKLTVFLSLSLLLLTGIVEGGVWLFGPFLNDSSQEVLLLTGTLFPALLFISLYGLNSALLQCYDSFFIPQIAPAANNLIWIGTALLLRGYETKEAMPLLAQGVVLGFIVQWVLTRLLVKRQIALPKFSIFSWKMPPEVFQFLRSFSLGALGVGAMQINSLLDALFARYIDVRAPTYLWYSIRIEQLALAILGLSCVTTIIPRLTRAIKEGRALEARALFLDSLKRIYLVMIPATFALFAAGVPLVNFLYGRGNFSSTAILETSFALMGYAIGLFPSTLVILFSALSYAKGDFRTPTYVSMLSVLMSLCLNSCFVMWGGSAATIALATSLSSWCNVILLRHLSLEKEGLNAMPVKTLLSLIAISFLAFVTTHLSTGFVGFGSLTRELSRFLTVQVMELAVSGAIFMCTLFLFAWILRHHALLTVAQEIFLGKTRSLSE